MNAEKGVSFKRAFFHCQTLEGEELQDVTLNKNNLYVRCTGHTPRTQMEPVYFEVLTSDLAADCAFALSSLFFNDAYSSSYTIWKSYSSVVSVHRVISYTLRIIPDSAL